ncbi:hypothetical protein TIFTF001_026261 [Ficus carica]|uniref:Uncharacterized protein n=1 Tax=Ficus carica TaxID=3494 RepID=A0AA88DKW1_FICCA|nr:hypothetical protein TIFTF001_026261 [Ficus carica]
MTVSVNRHVISRLHNSFNKPSCNPPLNFSYPLSPLLAAESAVTLPAAAFHLSHSPGDAAAALPSSSFDRRPQHRYPFSLILASPSTPPSPLSPFC